MSIARDTAGRMAEQITETVTGRGANYGPPEDNFANIAAFWRAWVKARHGVEVAFDGHDVGQMSAMIKLARLAQTPGHADSALDGAIYMMLGHGCAVDASQLEAALQSGMAHATAAHVEASGDGWGLSVPDGGVVGEDGAVTISFKHHPELCRHGTDKRLFCTACERSAL